MTRDHSMLPYLPLETERLVIRAYTANDLEVCRPLTQNPEIRTWIPTGVLSDEEHRSYIESCCQEDTSDFLVVLKETGEIVGEMNFHPWFVPDTWEIGWLILPEYQGKGFASEAAEALLNLGLTKMKLHRIISTAQPENTASWRVMEKIGMRKEGAFLQCIPRPDGSWWDEVFYALLASER